MLKTLKSYLILQLILILLFNSNNELLCQDWVRQNPFPTIEYVQDIDFDENGNGWAVGNNGMILHTVNWGQLWIIQDSGNENPDFNTVSILPGSNGQQVFVAGNDFLRTNDAGGTWEPVFEEPISTVYQIFALDNSHLFIVGNDSYKSMDGGTTWEEIEFPNSGSKTRISFIDPNNGWLAGGPHIYRTMDGGQTWEESDTTSYQNLRGINMFDAMNGVMAETKNIYNTNDGGVTWNKISDISIPTLTAMHAASEQVIWGCTNSGAVYYTADGGNTWLLEYPNLINNNKTIAIYGLSDGRGWVGGSYSSIIYSDDGAETWQDQIPGQKDLLSDIYFYDDDRGIAGGSEGHLLRTVDGGAIWENISMPVNESYFEVIITEEQTAYMLTSKGDVMKTIDFCETWNDIGEDLVPNPGSMSIVDDQHIYVLGQKGDIAITTNGGNSWSMQSLPSFQAKEIFFVNTQIGFVINFEGKVMKTEDGGANWSEVFDNNGQDMGSIYFIDEQKGWTIGNLSDTVWHTENGGSSWTPTKLPRKSFWHEFAFMNADTAWLTGGSSGSGLILKTIDRGSTWTREYDDITQFRSITAQPSNKAWAAGLGGNIVHFSPCNSIPEISDLTGPEILCERDTVNFEISSENVTVFTWSLPDDWVILGNSNTAKVEVLIGSMGGEVSVSGKNSCDSETEALHLNVQVFDVPEAVLSANNTELTVTEGESYVWFLDGEVIPGATSNLHSAVISGIYQAEVTYSTGCTSLSNAISVSITSVDDIVVDKILVFPNPTDGVVSMKCPTDCNIIYYELFNVGGRQVLSGSQLNGNRIDLSGISQGLYLLKMHSFNKVYVSRIMIIE